MSLEVEIMAPHQLFEFECGHTSEAMCCKCAEREKAEAGPLWQKRMSAMQINIKALEISTDELADRLGGLEKKVLPLEFVPCDTQADIILLEKRINELEQENIAIREHLAVLELRPQPVPYMQPHPYPGPWAPRADFPVQPGVPYWFSPVYCATTKGST